MGEEELKKLEELWKMRFIGEDEYQQRKEDILQAYPHLSSLSHSSPPSLSPQNLDLTVEDETSAELVRLNGAFEELRKTYTPSHTPTHALSIPIPIYLFPLFVASRLRTSFLYTLLLKDLVALFIHRTCTSQRYFPNV
jgi:hypothetical protein